MTRNSVKKGIQQPIEPLTADELHEAEVWILKQDQRKYFAKEIDILRKRQEDKNQPKKKKTFVPKSSPLYSLSPFSDWEDESTDPRCPMMSGILLILAKVPTWLAF